MGELCLGSTLGQDLRGSMFLVFHQYRHTDTDTRLRLRLMIHTDTDTDTGIGMGPIPIPDIYRLCAWYWYHTEIGPHLGVEFFGVS